MICLGYGLRDSLVHEAGTYISNQSELPKEISHYYTDFAIPYYQSILTWYASLRLGNSYSDIYQKIDDDIGLVKTDLFFFLFTKHSNPR